MTTLNIKNPTSYDDCFVKSGPDLKIAISLLKQRFYFSLIPLLIGFVCWILEGFLLSSRVIITIKDILFSAYCNYMYFLLMMGAMSMVRKFSKKLLETLLLKSSKNKSASVLELAEENDLETCSRVNVKAQKTSMKIGWFLLHFSLIFCFYYLIGSCTPSLSLHTKPSSNLFYSIPSTAELLRSPIIDQKAIPSSLIDQNPMISLKDNEENQIELPMSRILGKLNLPHADSLIVCQDRDIAFVSVRKPAGLIKIVSISDPENPQVLRSINLNQKSEFPLKSLALSPDNKTLVASNMISTSVIDVTDLLSPQVRGYAESPAFNEKFLPRPSDLPNASFRVSIAFSGNGKAVFIAGIGLLGYDISDMTAPKEILSDLETFEEKEPLMSSVSVQDNILYVAHGTLKSYNIENLPDISLLSNFSTKTQVNSLVFHQQNETERKKLFVIGRSSQGVILEEIDISDAANLKGANSFNLDLNSSQVPMLFAVTDSGKNVFITSGFHDLHIFNFAKKQCIYRNFENLIKPISSLALTISQQGQHVYIIANQLLIIYKLYKDYPNQRIFSSANSILGNHSTGYPGNFMSLISNDSILILATSKCRVKSDGPDNCQGNEAALELFNVSNPATPSNIEVRLLPAGLKALMVFPEQNSAYVTLENGIQIFDLSNNNLSLVSYFLAKNGTNIKNSVFTPDGKIGFLYENVSNHFTLTTYNFSYFENITRLGSMNFTSDPSSFDILLSNDHKTIFMIGNNTIKINVSDPREPSQINSLPIVTDGEGYGYTGFLAQNHADHCENLFIKVRDCNEHSTSLQFYNISNADSPYVLPDFPLLKSEKIFYTPIVPSPLHSDLIYLVSNTAKGDILLAMNISNATNPILQGTVPVSQQNGDIVSLVISNDGSTAYISTQSSGLQIVQLQVQRTLFLESEIFTLGPKVSTKILMLELNDEKEYIIMNSENFKIQEVSLFDLKIPSFSESVHLSNIQLPYWMNFDKYNEKFILHPQQEKDIGVYGLHSIYSTKVNLCEPSEISSIGNNKTLCQKLINDLIYFDYLDNQHFLTSNFGKRDDFSLSDDRDPYLDEIYNILKHFRFETYTTFEILPSLQITFEKNKIYIQTPNEDDLRVEILLHSEPKAQFLNKHYGLLQPVINNKTEIILEGPLKQINTALKELVINLEDNLMYCNGTVIVDDHLNPPQIREIRDIHNFFNHNENPRINISGKDIQSSIEKTTSISIKNFFSIPLENVFNDTYYPEGLTYELVQDDATNSSIPPWLILDKKTLQGTPPEEWSGKKLNLKLIGKNEFKSSEDVKFVLKINLSWWYLAEKYLLTILKYLWLLIPFLLGKKYCSCGQKGPQNLKLEVDQDITPQTIHPIFFAQRELHERKLILGYLRRAIAPETSIHRQIISYFFTGRSNLKIVSYFTSEDGKLEKTRVFQKIQETVENEISEEEKKSLFLYLHDCGDKRNFISQLVFNQIVFWKLDSPEQKVIKKVLKTFQNDFGDLVDWDPDWSFKCTLNSKQRKINENIFSTGLNSTLAEPFLENLENSRQENRSYDLLDAAIEAYALEQQIIKMEADKIKVVIQMKLEKKWMTRIKQRDTQTLIPLKSVNCGIRDQISENMLLFSGKLDSKFADETIVIQIKTAKHSIKEFRGHTCRELWIDGIQADQEPIVPIINHEAENAMTY